MDSVQIGDLYERYGATVFRFVIMRVRDPAVAEEVTAETFLSAAKGFHRSGLSVDEARPWLFRVAHNRIADHYRAHSRRTRLFQRLTGHDVVGDIEESVVTRAELRAALGAMDRLSKRDRTVIAARVAGLSNAEIAKLIRVKESAAAVAIQRAFVRLREARDNDD